jgi:hypothetical protein
MRSAQHTIPSTTKRIGAGAAMVMMMEQYGRFEIHDIVLYNFYAEESTPRQRG